jgi:hypothetical protein
MFTGMSAGDIVPKRSQRTASRVRSFGAAARTVSKPVSPYQLGIGGAVINVPMPSDSDCLTRKVVIGVGERRFLELELDRYSRDLRHVRCREDLGRTCYGVSTLTGQSYLLPIRRRDGASYAPPLASIAQDHASTTRSTGASLPSTRQAGRVSREVFGQ